MVLPVDIEGALFGYLKSSQLKSHEEAAVAEVDDLPREAGLMSMGPLVAVYDECHLFIVPLACF